MRQRREAGTARKSIMVLSEEDVAEWLADLERAQREKEAMQADLERAQRERDAAVAKKEAKKREYEAELEWLQSENVEMTIFSLLEGPQQSAPTAVALAPAAPAAEAMTDTCVFPDTAAPDAPVETAALKLMSAAGNSNSSGNGSSSSSNDTTSNHGSWWDTTCVVALLRPFDPGEGCQRDTRRGKAVLGVDLTFDRGKA